MTNPTAILQVLYPRQVLTVKEVSDLLGRAADVLTVTLYRLQNKGLVERTESGWQLTREGREDAKTDRTFLRKLLK